MICSLSSIIFSQDIIVKRNGDQIKSKITRITSENIVYKDFDFQEGPDRVARNRDVFMVIYESGRREIITPTRDNAPKKIAGEKTDPIDERPKKVYKGNYFMIGTGYGNSYGGLGLRLQGRFGGKVGFGFHGGVGYLPGYSVLAAGGIKFFPYKGLYIDTQFGLTGYESYSEIYSGSFNSSYFNDNALYGPSILTGIDQVWGKKVGFGFNIGVGASYNLNAEYSSNILPAFDIGFIIRF
jgi:hypothetical protein